MERLSAYSRAEAFPYGLRVLVVDDDPTWLKILEKMLKKCSYEVTTCSLATSALQMLRERKDRFDIVISDVNMPDMDGFKLLEHVGLEMDLPVIMMSVDGETSRVMKGVQHGACDYLLKPVRMKELRNIWQHVYRKKIHEVKDTESHDSNEDIQIFRSQSEDFDERYVFSGADLNSARKRKDMDNKEHFGQEFNDPSSVKKARVVWSVDLHRKFVDAVNQIGFNKVGPKKILDLMNVPGLTRENVASHLQKYRLYLSRLQKPNEVNTSGRNMQSDSCAKYSPESFAFQSSITKQRNNIDSTYVCTTQKVQSQAVFSDIQVDDLKSIASLQVTDTKRTAKSDVADTQKLNNISQLGVLVSFKGMMPSVDHEPLDSAILKHQSLSSSIPLMQVMQYPKSNVENSNLLGVYSSLPQPTTEYNALGSSYTASSLISITCNTERGKTDIYDIKPSSMDLLNGHMRAISPVTCMIDTVSVQLDRGLLNVQECSTPCDISASSAIKDFYVDQIGNCNFNLLSPSQDPSLKNGQDLVSFPEDLQFYSLEGCGCFDSIGLNGVGIFDYNDQGSVKELHNSIYDGAEFDIEHLHDSMDYPLIDGCLFT